MPELYCPVCHWFGRYDERERHTELCSKICSIAKKDKENKELKEKNNQITKNNIDATIIIT
jgi:hypothetical protein